MSNRHQQVISLLDMKDRSETITHTHMYICEQNKSQMNLVSMASIRQSKVKEKCIALSFASGKSIFPDLTEVDTGCTPRDTINKKFSRDNRNIFHQFF